MIRNVATDDGLGLQWSSFVASIFQKKRNPTWRIIKVSLLSIYQYIGPSFIVFFFLTLSYLIVCISFINFSSLEHTTFGHTNINLYNNYASSSYATYTQPQYTTANPNRCPANANIKLNANIGSGSGNAIEHTENQRASNTSNSIKRGHHPKCRKNNRWDNGNNGNKNYRTVVANNTNCTLNHDPFNESVIEEGHNNLVSSFFFQSKLFCCSFLCLLVCLLIKCNKWICWMASEAFNWILYCDSRGHYYTAI